MDKKWNMIEVKNEISIPFQWIDTIPGGGNLGRAEFQICIKFRRKRVSEFWVYPKQQRTEDCWHFLGGDRHLSISSYQGLTDPKVWLVSFCDEHKTQVLNIYAPNDAKFLRIDYYGISFCKTAWGA